VSTVIFKHLTNFAYRVYKLKALGRREFMSSGMWRRVVGLVVSDVSKTPVP